MLEGAGGIFLQDGSLFERGVPSTFRLLYSFLNDVSIF